MFSLIITIISIALVAALALATLYYGGNAYTEGSADAKAAEIANQGQQILGAAEMYYSRFSTYPTVEQLVDSDYLKIVPTAQAQISSAHAESNPWRSPFPGRAVYTLAQVPSAVCAGVNFRAYGVRGVLAQLRATFMSQCYGADTDELTVVVTKEGTGLLELLPDDTTTDVIPDATDIPAWSVPPTETVAGGSGGGEGGGPEPEEPGTPEDIPEGSTVGRTQFSLNVLNANQPNQTVAFTHVLVDREYPSISVAELGSVVYSGQPWNIHGLGLSLGGESQPLDPQSVSGESSVPVSTRYIDENIGISGGTLASGSTREAGEGGYAESFGPDNIGEVQRTDLASWRTVSTWAFDPYIALTFFIVPDAPRAIANTWLEHDGTNSGTWCMTWQKDYAWGRIHKRYTVVSALRGACN